MKPTNQWYRMAAPASADGPAEILIYDEIGFWGITAGDFLRDLRALGPVTSIDLRINSPGGEVMDALAITNQLLAHPARIVAYVDGWAASSAGLVAMAGDEVQIAENAWFMIHNPWVFMIGEEEDLRRHADVLAGIKQQGIRLYRRHSSLSEDEISDLMDDETWMDAAATVANGFASATFAATAAIAASASADRSRFTLASAPEAARRLIQPPPASPAEESTVPKPNPNPAHPTADPAPNDPAPPTPAAAATTDAAQLAADRAALTAERDAARAERLAALRERLEAAVDRDLEQLGSRLTPGMRRAGTRDAGALASALLALRMADNGPTVQLAVTRDGQEATVELGAYDVVLAALRAAPEFTALGAGPMADADGDAPPALDRRTAEQRSYDRGKGITDEQALATQARHPGAYGAPN